VGITYNTNVSTTVNENINPTIIKMQNSLKIWRMRKLTPLGTITGIKTVILPIITHTLTSVPSPNNQQITDIEDIFFEFIWNKPKTKTKRSTLTRNINEGGLKMVDLNNYIKI
jgi:hypothetical protein